MKHGYWYTVDKVLNHSDIVINVLDARFIEESRNRDIERMIREKGRRLVFALNKCDLMTDQKIRVPKDMRPYVIVSGKMGYGIPNLKVLLKILSPKKEGKPIVGVVGYPNVGKSSVINRLRGKGVVRTSSIPGFTRGKQYVSTPDYMLIDTPGVIPRKETDELKHIKMVSKSFDTMDPEIAAHDLLSAFPGLIEGYFDLDIREDRDETLKDIAKKKNLIKKGNIPDVTRAAKMILQLWQDAKITPGRITKERKNHGR